MYHTVMVNMGYRRFTALLEKRKKKKKENAVLVENRIQMCFHDRTCGKIHRGCVLMDKYTQVVPWSKIIVQKYIICFRENVYRAQSQKATVNFNFSRHVQFLHALFTM